MIGKPASHIHGCSSWGGVPAGRGGAGSVRHRAGPPIRAHVDPGAGALAVVGEYGEWIACGPLTVVFDSNVLMDQYTAKCLSRDTVRGPAHTALEGAFLVSCGLLTATSASRRLNSSATLVWPASFAWQKVRTSIGAHHRVTPQARCPGRRPRGGQPRGTPSAGRYRAHSTVGTARLGLPRGRSPDCKAPRPGRDTGFAGPWTRPVLPGAGHPRHPGHLPFGERSSTRSAWPAPSPARPRRPPRCPDTPAATPPPPSPAAASARSTPAPPAAPHCLQGEELGRGRPPESRRTRRAARAGNAVCGCARCEQPSPREWCRVDGVRSSGWQALLGACAGGQVRTAYRFQRLLGRGVREEEAVRDRGAPSSPGRRRQVAPAPNHPTALRLSRRPGGRRPGRAATWGD